ncbi:MAG: two-component system osmolarity sensor histidine kinase EnvZ [Rickettsiales bacterium]|jgi:two-component system osmolarity sensor histidine kinase EnvZ
MIIVPTIIIQIVAIYVFFYTYVDNISKHMARGVLGEMAFIKNSIDIKGNRQLVREFSENVGLEFYFIPKRKLNNKTVTIAQKRKSNKVLDLLNPFPIIDPLNRFKIELESQGFFPFYISKHPSDDSLFVLTTQVKKGLLKFYVPEKRVTSSAKYVFTMWLIITSILASLISILFLRNQIKSIKGLSDAAEKFGRGLEAPHFKPSGAREIRLVGIAFIRMRDRIMRQISSRTQMLSAVSHDLRTPLTRMKLQLEMMTEDEAVLELKSDIFDMEKMINEYLDFSKSANSHREKNKETNIKEYLEKIVIYYQKMNKNVIQNIDISADFSIFIKRNSLKRAIRNLIDNSFHYGDEVEISAKITHKNLKITIDDNGCGVPESQREEMFKPFWRIDNSRNLDKTNAHAGAGLGLSIVMDVVRAHGGKIKVSDNPQKGLRMTILLPI